MEAGHGGKSCPGWNLPGQKSVFTLTEPVCCLSASLIPYLWDVMEISFFRSRQRPQLPSSFPSLCLLLAVNQPAPRCVKKCLSLCFDPIPEVSPLCFLPPP